VHHAELQREAAGDLGHRRQERKPALGVGDCFEGDGSRPGVKKSSCQLGRGSEMEVREEKVIIPQQRNLFRLRLLDFDDELGRVPKGLGCWDQAGALYVEGRVVESRTT
jgi:hypothetical protein